MTEAVSDAMASMLSTCTTCHSWAEQDEGPYHRDAQPLRRDIVEDRVGVPLQLGIRLAADRDTPLRDAMVEIWHCDASGRYSGFPPAGGSDVVTAETSPRGTYLSDQTFLRGRQRSDAAGMAGADELGDESGAHEPPGSGDGETHLRDVPRVGEDVASGLHLR